MLLHVTAASAKPAGKIAILGPERSAIVPRLQRNFADTPTKLSSVIVSSCTRLGVAKQLYDLDADTAICTDGDVVSVWKMEDDNVHLVDAIPILHGDDRSLEVIAARATISARDGAAPVDASSTTIVASGDTGRHDTAAVMASANEPAGVDKPLPNAALPPERLAPRALFAVGPMLLASKPGGAFAMSVSAELGVSRVVTFIPWFATMPVAQSVSTPNGSAYYRPTLFGLGFGVPLRSHKKTLVPRLGAGYALIWMRVWPDQAKATGTTLGESEDLWAPAMYMTAALSVGVTERFRIAGEGLLGTSTHNLIVRIARENTASWGAPLASLGLRAELVLP